MVVEALSWKVKDLDFSFLEQKPQTLEFCNPHGYEQKGDSVNASKNCESCICFSLFYFKILEDWTQGFLRFIMFFNSIAEQQQKSQKPQPKF